MNVPDVSLDRVRSFEKQQELLDVLHSEDPDHYSRLWLVGFLKFAGYSVDEICALIAVEACWTDYDARMTWCQVRGIFHDQRSTLYISSRFEGVGAAPGGTLQSSPYERTKAACAIAYTSCKDCSDPQSCRSAHL